VVEKQAAVVGRAVVTADIASGSELWLIWAHIAIEHAEGARAARAEIVKEAAAGSEPDLNTELYPALIAIAAAATSLDGFATEVKKCGIPIKTPRVQQPTRAHWIWETLRAGFDVGSKTNSWPRDIKELFGLRVGGLHPKTVFGQPVQHPVVPNVPEARATYTTEAADAAVALMRDVYRTCRTTVRPAYPLLVSRISGFASAMAQVAP
jgi:hypothetical protein